MMQMILLKIKQIHFKYYEKNKNISHIFFFYLLLFSNASSKENKILFKLNNEIITSVDILNEIKYLSILNQNFSTIEKRKQFEIAKYSLLKQKIKYI